MNILEEIKLSFRKGNIVTRLIYINLAVFIILNLVFVVFRISISGMTPGEIRLMYNEKVMQYLMVPSLPAELIRKPWTIITYMFTHFDFLHILFNLLWLYWFGRIFLQYFTEKQLLSTYLIGGVAGAIFFMIFLNVFPGLRQHLGADMLGASAAVMAIVIGISFYVPDYTVHLIFLGPVRLKYIALVMLVLDVIMIASNNAGGHIAHLGGAFYGYLYTRQYRKGKDIGKWLNDLLDQVITIFKPRSRLNVTYRNNARYMSDTDYNKGKAERQREIDRILDKIAKSGYESLTKEEKETLFKMGKNNT